MKAKKGLNIDAGEVYSSVFEIVIVALPTGIISGIHGCDLTQQISV